MCKYDTTIQCKTLKHISKIYLFTGISYLDLRCDNHRLGRCKLVRIIVMIFNMSESK